MPVVPGISRYFATAAFAIALATGTPARAELNQAEALAAAAAVNRGGSDESLQNSTTSAMRAMLELNNQNRPGAVKNGYQSFGEYRTSRDLDIVRMKNKIRQIDLFTNTLSINSSPASIPAWARTREVYVTTFARLDPKFLHQGEAGKVAEEFERKSGMRREDFLKKMAKASESVITSSDPNLTAKVMNKFAAFVEDIPNDEFRNNVKKQINEVSDQSKTALIKDGALHIYDVLSKYKINVSAKLAAARDFVLPDSGSRAPASGVSATGAPESGYVAVTGVGRRPEDPLVSTKNAFLREIAPQDADLKSLANDKGALGSVMQTALDEQGETSIFKQVSRRYRAVTPSLVSVRQ